MKQRGVALLLVLWVIALLAALIGAFVLTARIEAMQGRVLSDGAQAQEIARAGIEYALVRVADTEPRTHWRPDGRMYTWHFADSEVTVRIADEAGKVDLNDASFDTLHGLLRAVGIEAQLAERLTAAIVDWRDEGDEIHPQGGAEAAQYQAAGLPYGPKNARFDTIAELEQVLGMTPEMYARLAPYITVYSGRAEPDPRFALEPVLIAVGLDAQKTISEREQSPAGGSMVENIDTGSGTYSIESIVRLPNGRQEGVREVVNVAPRTLVPGVVYDVLRRDEGVSQ